MYVAMLSCCTRPLEQAAIPPEQETRSSDVPIGGAVLYHSAWALQGCRGRWTRLGLWLRCGSRDRGWAAMEDPGQLQAPVKPVRRENTYITEPSGYGEVRWQQEPSTDSRPC